MSALAMMLSAALLAGSAPEKVSEEMQQKLDPSGRWEGRWADLPGPEGEVSITGRRILFRPAKGAGPDFAWVITDEGGGKLRVEKGGFTELGIYRQEEDRLIICLAEPHMPRPQQLYKARGQDLLILRRVKPRK